MAGRVVGTIRAFLRELPETDVEPATSAGTMMDG
jgi:hypothetical protein